MKRNSFLTLLAFMLLIAALFSFLTACGAKNGPEQEAKASKIVVGIPQDFDSLDPHIAQASGTEEIMFNVFTGLTMPSTAGELVPALAEKWEISADSTAYTFYLRKGVKFHNGSNLSAADVKYSYDRLCGKIPGEEKALKSTFANVIKEVEVLNDSTVKIVLKSRNAKFLSDTYIGIIPKDSGPSQASSPVGTGPYKFVDYTAGVGMNLAKFADYYEKGLPKLDHVEIKIFADLNAGVLALSNREIQFMQIVYDTIAQIPKGDFVIEQYPMNTVQLMGLNNNFKPFQDKRVRQALNYAIDKQQIIAMLAPGAPEVDSNFSPVMAYWYEDLKDYYSRDIEKAKKLLAEAGYPNLSFTIKVPGEYPIHVNAAQIIEQQYKDAGITVKIQVVDWNTWLTEVYAGRNHEATIIGLTGKLDPDNILKRFSSGYSRNFINFNNPRYDQLIKDGEVESNAAKRVEIYKEAQRILTEEAASVFIMDPINYVAVDARLEGFKYYPIYFIDLRYLDYKK
ncbi:ABC transporter substrate-binding protein [Spirochaetota bacterium]